MRYLLLFLLSILATTTALAGQNGVMLAPNLPPAVTDWEQLYC